MVLSSWVVGCACIVLLVFVGAFWVLVCCNCLIEVWIFCCGMREGIWVLAVGFGCMLALLLVFTGLFEVVF